MVVSKKCKICTALEADNIPISGEYFGKSLPELIGKISGINMDPRKTKGVLICQQCAIQLVHTDVVIDKLRNTLQRLKILVKETKHKTPSKMLSKSTGELNNVEQVDSNNLGTANQTNLDESKIHDDIKPKTVKKVVRRKSVFPDESPVNNGVGSRKTEVSTSAVTNKKFEQIINNVEKSAQARDENIAELENVKKLEKGGKINLEESKIQNDTKQNTSRKVVRRKSVFPNGSLVNNDEVECKQVVETPNTASSKLKKIIDDEASSIKFKKITDNDSTPIKSKNISENYGKSAKATKRNSSPIKGNPSNITNIHLNDADAIGCTPQKRNKRISISVNDETAMDLSIDEQHCTAVPSSENNDGNGLKIKALNCVICGKRFIQKRLLRDHIETSHMGEKIKQCPHCSAEFWSQQKYESHVFSEKCKNTLHACQYPKCNKRFKTVHKMESHMWKKHSSQNELSTE